MINDFVITPGQEELDEQEDIRLYDDAMAEDGEAIPFYEAVKMIESKRSPLLT